MADWPRTYVPLDDDGQPDHTRAQVDVFLHRPDLTDELVAWSQGEQLTVNGGPVVMLPGSNAAQRMVGLGDFALRYPAGRMRVEHADGFATRYQPAEGAE